MKNAQERRLGSKLFILFISLFALIANPVFAQEPPPEGDEDAPERISSLDAQRQRRNQRASLWGGSGIVFTRTALLLPRKALNLSGYFIYSHYQYLQGQGSLHLDDPRMNDYETNIVAVYGVTPYLELSAFMNIFLQNERSDADQLHMRQMGVGWTGIDAKLRLMDFYRHRMGISTTAYLRFPTPQQGSNITSREIGYGAEINVSIHMVIFSKWLDKFTLHGNLGYGHFDWFDTGLAAFYQKVRKNGTLFSHLARGGKYKSYDYSELLDPTWGPDDFRMEHLWMSADHYTGSFAFEYRPYSGLSMGFELVGYRMISRRDDNLQLAPFVTYTLVELPFFKKIHKDIVTISLAGNIGLRSLNRSAPEYGVVAGISYHTDLKF